MAEPLFPITVVDAVARIRARNDEIRAFVSTRDLDRVLAESDAGAEGARGPLHGVPFSLKDEWETAELATTGGSWRHRARRPAHDARVLSAFRDAGAVFLGKTNLSDLGLPPEASSWVGGKTRNPFDRSRTAGGSSGGSAAAVADGMSGFDWGTDIGGSIRFPAACVGIYGTKLSTETWPITDLFPRVPQSMTWLCSQGPLTRTIAQQRAVLDAAAPVLRKDTGRPPFVANDALVYAPTSLGKWPTFARDVAPSLERAALRVTTKHELGPTRAAHDLYNRVWCSHFGDLFEADPSLTLASGLSMVILALLFRGLVHKGIHPRSAELLLLIAIGSLIYRDKAKSKREAMDYKSRFEKLWARGAVVVMPVCAWPAPRVGWTNFNTRLLECSVPGNLADATGVAIPFGHFPGTPAMPRAIQLLGPPGSEHELLRIAERLTAE
jgi:Asp-tRNA(Asn)/Glu-tRNA(Gln) amidotransferase A subunit family amidase